jgi:tetratricopeptide (TPR) repeat protein
VDLPAPKGVLPPRTSAQPSRSGTGITDLPAPKTRRPTPLSEGSKVAESSRPEPAGVVDLPAPKAKTPGPLKGGAPGAPGAPVPRPPPKALLDLPAPKPRGIGELPPSAIGGLGDLPAPKRDPAGESRPARREPITSSSFADLVGPRSPGDLPAPRQGLADLPAPRRGGVEPPATRPLGAPDRSGPKQAGAPDLPGLKLGGAPAPAGPKQAGMPDLPGPKQAGTPGLPAPKIGGLPDLPAPRTAAPDLPAPKIGGLPDLPAPRSGLPDLPAPRTAAPDLPAPKIGGLPDLPAPRSGATGRPAPKIGGLPDLPAPRSGGPDLPAPRPAGAPDLPAPRPAGAPDLPAPRPAGAPDLPAPRPGSAPAAPAAPAAKGFFDDLPQPVAAAPTELPAPKGFFDDLPQPVAAAPTELPAPKGFFDDLPGRTNATKPQPAEPPTPKGFFDDLPGRPGATRPQPAEPPAPKGFFDDLPGRPDAARPQPAEPPAPKGFFDDLPGRPGAAKPQPAEPPAPKGFFDDLPAPAGADQLAPTEPAGFFDNLEQPEHDLPGPPGTDTDEGPGELDLGLEGSPSLQLDAVTDAAFDELERRGTTAPIPAATAAPAPASSAARRPPTPAKPVAAATEPEPPTATAGDLPRGLDRRGELPLPLPKPSPKMARDLPLGDGAHARRVRQLRILVIAVSVLLGLAAGGLFLYRRHAQEVERRTAIEARLTAARSELGARDARRWERAAAAAQQAIELDPRNAAAIGLAAEAMLADALASGGATAAAGAAGKAARARTLLGAALADGLSGPELERAQALSLATARQPDTARLEKVAAAAPQDLTLALYLGWAHAARGDHAAAAAAFTRAVPAEPLKLPALLGRAHAKLALADLSGARADFEAILALDKDHLAAQVGLAAALPASQAQQQEAALLAILSRKDLAAADPRVVLQAWVLAAEAARRAGKLEPARERYRKAQALAPQDATVLTGLAELELQGGKLDTAVETIEKALALDPGHVTAQLVAADLAIRQKRLDDAGARLQALRTRSPPLPALAGARRGLLEGKLLDAQGQDAAAADAYVAAAELSGDADLTPALTAVTKLHALAEAAETTEGPERAAELRTRADRLIARFDDRAKRDPQIALALGAAFLQANAAARAEPWLRRAVAARPGSADAHYQLARALAILGRTDDAIDEIHRAHKIAGGRAEIGIELARIYEAAGREDDAAEAFAKLLAAKDPGIEVRAAAGRFYARRGELAKAAEQGERILALEPANPAGRYLKAEGALAAGNVEEAAKLFREAVDADRDPQYLDGQGRAAEALAAQTGDAKLLDLALRVYIAAAEAAPAMLGPLLGQGRIHVARRDAAKAIPPLLAASKLAPEHPEIARLIGLAYKELAERRVAAEWLARAYRLAPAAETAWHLGQLYSELNVPREAVTALTNATRLGLEQEKKAGAAVPWRTDALYKLGRIHMDAGNERAAKSAWEKYVRRGPRPGAQLDEVRRELATTLQRY